MRALTVAPSAANSACGGPPTGALPQRTLALGVCATDREIVSGVHGRTPPGGKWAIGHESLGGVTQVGGAPGRSFNVDRGSVSRTLVLDNERVFASVNANAVAAPEQVSKVRLGSSCAACRPINGRKRWRRSWMTIKLSPTSPDQFNPQHFAQ